MSDPREKRVVTIPGTPWQYEVWSDSYRLWAKQVSELPLHHDYDKPGNPIIPVPEGGWEPECVYEWKHSYFGPATELSELILGLAFSQLPLAK